jgi:uncharacterized protein (TIGR02145 family)
MKKSLLLSSLLSFVFCLLSSQVPQGFTYQAIARDISGNALANQTLPVRITIQSDSLGGTTFWIEEHPLVSTNNIGLFTLILGKGEMKTGSSVSSFNEINWSVIPKFIKTEINYGGWKYMGTSRLWSVPYSMVAGDINDTLKKLVVKGETDLMDEALFEVKNKKGQTVFAVYNEGVRIYVDDGKAKGTTKGGFAIGGLGSEKSSGQEYLRVTRDSTRIYVNDQPFKGATKGGFAIGGFSAAKEPALEYLRVTPDSTRIYLNDNTSKGATKGGFAIGGLSTAKAPGQEYLRVTPDSTRIYVNDSNTKGATKGGFAIGGFDAVKNGDKEFLRVTSDSVKVSKSLLIPRLTAYERDHLSFIPGEALIIFNITEGCMQIFKNNVWSNIWCFNCAPAFLIQPVDNIICSGNNVNFFVSATGTNLSYQWQISTDNGSTWNNLSDGGTNPVYSGAKSYSLKLSGVPVSYNNYKFRCYVAGPCLPNITSNAVLLNVGSTPPLFTQQPANQILSKGCAASFSVSSPGYGLTYKWQQSTDGGTSWNNISNGGTNPVFSGSTTPTLSLSNVPWSCNNYKYRCIASNLCGGDATSDPALLTISPTSILTQPVNQQLTTGCSSSFNISTAAGYTVFYQWQVSADGGNTWGNLSNGGTSPVYSGVTTATLSLSNVPWSCNNNKYRCVVSSICGPNETSTAGTLTIAPSSILTQPSNQTLSDNCTASFGITSPAGYVINYQWQISSNGGANWNNISNGGTSPVYGGATSATLSLSNVPLTFSDYQFRCNVISVCGPNETSNVALLMINATPLITAQPENKMVYASQNASFEITTTGSFFSNQWQESTDGGSTWANVNEGGSNPSYSGTNTPKITLSNIPASYNNYQYRCFGSGCRPNGISDAAILSVLNATPVSDVDGNVYATVGIGTQLWMAENLKTTKYRNGDLIGTTSPANKDISGESEPKYQWAYGGNESNVSVYGRLYTWYAATDNRNVCPTGWHLSSNEDWTTMINYLGEFEAAGKLKESGTVHWFSPNVDASNASGFTALPGGLHDPNVGFCCLRDYGFWWLSTEVSATDARKWELHFDDSFTGVYDYDKKYGFSIRCVKDSGK